MTEDGACPRFPWATILVVEDDDDFREALGLTVESLGATVRLARDGHEALRSLRVRPVNLVLCDLQMPRMDGFALRTRLDEDVRLSGVRVLALSAHASAPDLRRTRDAGFDGHLAKPVAFETLAAEVHRLLVAGAGACWHCSKPIRAGTGSALATGEPVHVRCRARATLSKALDADGRAARARDRVCAARERARLFGQPPPLGPPE